jgi:hypothetical protein
VKLFTNIVVRYQEIDLIAGILNTLDDTIGSIDYSFEENAKKIKNNDKCLVFKTKARLHAKENPFISMI